MFRRWKSIVCVRVEVVRQSIIVAVLLWWRTAEVTKFLFENRAEFISLENQNGFWSAERGGEDNDVRSTAQWEDHNGFTDRFASMRISLFLPSFFLSFFRIVFSFCFSKINRKHTHAIVTSITLIGKALIYFPLCFACLFTLNSFIIVVVGYSSSLLI